MCIIICRDRRRQPFDGPYEFILYTQGNYVITTLKRRQTDETEKDHRNDKQHSVSCFSRSCFHMVRFFRAVLFNVRSCHLICCQCHICYCRHTFSMHPCFLHCWNHTVHHLQKKKSIQKKLSDTAFTRCICHSRHCFNVCEHDMWESLTII